MPFLTREQAMEMVATLVSEFPERNPLEIAYDVGKLGGFEYSAYLVATGLPGEVRWPAVRGQLVRLCQLADELAMRYVDPGVVVPSAEVRMAGRTWLRPA